MRRAGKPECRPVRGGVGAPEGFRAAGGACGIKKSGAPDLAVVLSDYPARAAGVFTANKVCAAPVVWCRKVVGGRDVRVIVANSGNANACTGARGHGDAERMAVLTADACGVSAGQVLVCSTGRIGRPLPMERIERAIPGVVAAAAPGGSHAAARAIMTSDTRPKECAVETVLGGGTVRVGGIAKGAGMIDPCMATMLAFVTTDAAIRRSLLVKALRHAVGGTFNRITVDGDMSTNDTVLVLANGQAGNDPVEREGEDFDAFCDALSAVCLDLAKRIVGDGERVSRFVEVHVRGAASERDARRVADAVAKSQLVKSAWSGGDPNWGRIVCAAGYSGARVDPDAIAVDFDDVAAVRGGVEVSGGLAAMRRVVRKKRFRVTVDLNLGDGASHVFTTDLTPEYVAFNQRE